MIQVGLVSVTNHQSSFSENRRESLEFIFSFCHGPKSGYGNSFRPEMKY